MDFKKIGINQIEDIFVDRISTQIIDGSKRFSSQILAPSIKHKNALSQDAMFIGAADSAFGSSGSLDGVVYMYGGDYMVVSGPSSIRFKITDDGSTIIGSDLSDYVSNGNEFQVVGKASFSDIATAPTAPAGANTTQIATTAFVQAAVSSGTYTPTGLATNYLPKWNGSGFVDSSWQEFAGGRLSNTGNDDLTNKLQVDGSGKFSGIMNAKSYKADFNNSTANFIAEFDNLDNGVTKTKILYGAVDQPPGTGVYHNIFTKWNNAFGTILSTATYDGGGQDLFIKSKYDGTWSNWNKIVKENTDGTISASPATTANQVVVKSQLDAAAARPYKVYTALLSQLSTNAPTATVLENTLGGTVVWTRIAIGEYKGTLSGVFTVNKTTVFISPFTPTGTSVFITGQRDNADGTIYLRTVNNSGTTTIDTALGSQIEIRVYL